MCAAEREGESVTGAERLKAAVEEFKEATNQAISEIWPSSNGDETPLTHEQIQHLIDSRIPNYRAVLMPLLSVIDAIHEARKRDNTIDHHFRKAGVVTKNTAGYRFPAERAK